MGNYDLIFSGRFRKDFKKIQNKPKEFKKVVEVFDILISGGYSAIPKEMKPHKLLGNYKGNRECHIFPDLLLIWEQTEEPKEITLIRLGSHSELFK